MELMENGESNMVEQSEIHSDPSAPNCQMDHERCVTETAEQKEMTGAQNVEKTSVLSQEQLQVIGEIGLPDGGISHNKDVIEQEPALENVRIDLDSKYMEVASQNGFTCLEHMRIPPGTNGNLEPVKVEATNDSFLLGKDDSGSAGVNPVCRKLESVEVGASNDSVVLENADRGSSGVNLGDGRDSQVKVEATSNSGFLENDDRGSSKQRRERKAKSKGPVASSWVLRPKSQEKIKAPEPVETVKESSANGEKKKRGRKPKNMQNNNINEFSRTRTHLRYLLHRISYEQNLIDAYSAEGWRGQR